jgi:precorrin-6Y C5,15-methyltransferase (decarboxylating)
MAADLLVGGRRHLDYFPQFSGSKLTIGAEIETVVESLRQARQQNRQVVVLASGDPLCYGIGASLRRYFPAEALEIIPAPTAFQLAFAALAEPWHEAALLSAHARPLADVVAGVLAATKAAILTDNRHTPPVIAQALLQAGLAPDTPCAICENLGSDEQCLIRTELSQVEQETYAPLNVFVVWPLPLESRFQPEKAEPPTTTNRLKPRLQPHNTQESRLQPGEIEPESPYLPISPSSLPPGLPDEAFSTSGGQITKREVRLLSLAELALQPHDILWDIGAGSGAMGIEAARACPTATVYAIEKRAEMCQHIYENLRRFGTPNLHLTEGTAPEDIHRWPDPNAVFVGGSGGRLEALIKMICQRLQPGGRIVLNLATLENLYMIHQLLPKAQVIQVQINRGVPILEMLRFEALNPVFIVSWQK